MSAGKPKLIMLPGLDGTGDLFAEVLPLLNRFDAQVITYPRDQVLSEPELLLFIRKRLPHEPFVLLAESFSAPFALKLAAEHPRGLRGLILSVGFATNPANIFEHAALALIAPIATRLPMTAFATRLFLVNGNEPREHVRAVQRAVDSVAAPVLLARLRQSTRCDVRPALAGIDVPVLYLRATRDRLIPQRCADEILLGCAHVQLQSFDAPHTLLLARPAETAAAITEFATQLDKVER